MIKHYITTGTWNTDHWEGVTASQLTDAPTSFVFPGVINRDGSGDIVFRSYGNYWSSTSNGPSRVFYLDVGVGGRVLPRGNGDQSYGVSVRCMVNPSVHNGMYMQDVSQAIIENTPTDVTYTLKDKRDETEYTVAKLKDGNLWMTQNLELGEYGTPMNLTSALSNVSPSGYTLTFDYANNSVYKGNSNKYGNYYTWPQATAGSGTTTADQNAPYDICPKNWRLSLSSTTVPADSEFYILMDNYISGSTWNDAGWYWPGTSPSVWMSAPLSFVLSGFMYGDGSLSNQNTDVRLWSATSNGISSMNLSAYTNGRVYPADTNDHNRGFSVRCLSPSS